nr:hypothetical protein [Tanacetum cinerariifolium]GEZ53838.1 hypothetical protein [Tanacetum cinerariifolium]
MSCLPIFVDIIAHTTWLMRMFPLLLPQDLMIKYFHLLHRLNANLLREALEITLVDQAHQFVSPPSGDAIMNFVNQLVYPGEIHFVSRIAVNNLYQPWSAILSMINQCLTGNTSGFDRPRYADLQMLWGIITRINIDYVKLMWEEFVQAIHTFLIDKANLGSPIKKGKKTKPYVIPYCRFTKLIIYYLRRYHNIYQRCGSPLNLAEDDLSLGNLKHKQRIDAVKEGGKKKTTPKADKPMKPVPSKQAKPTTGKQPKPKPVQAHVGGVAIREPVAEATRPLPVVEGKGKAITTEEQVAQSLLALHTPKRKNPGKTSESRPPPEDDKMDEDQVGSDLVKSHVALARSNPEPMHDDFVDIVYPKVHESLKFMAGEQDLPHKINQTINEVVKEAVHIALQASLRDHFRELPEADMKEILYQPMFESGSNKSLPKHVALY